MRDDVDGGEAMVPRMPNLPPQPSAEAGVVIALRRRVERTRILHKEKESCLKIGIDYGFCGRDREDVLPILFVQCRNSSTGCRLHSSKVWDSREFW